jgi:hypothetical protein
MAKNRGLDVDSLSAEDLAVQALDSEIKVCVDGPLQKIIDTSCVPVVLSPIPDALSGEDAVLESPFDSPKSPLEADLSVTTLEDDEIPEDLLVNTKETNNILVKVEETTQGEVDDGEQIGMCQSSIDRIVSLIMVQSSEKAKAASPILSLPKSPKSRKLRSRRVPCRIRLQMLRELSELSTVTLP